MGGGRVSGEVLEKMIIPKRGEGDQISESAGEVIDRWYQKGIGKHGEYERRAPVTRCGKEGMKSNE